MGQTPNIKKIKRVVQTIVDQILNEETSLVGLTTIRDYDEYTFTHSVNVCIFSVALGRRLGLTRLQLFDLGLAALFHDIGKSRVPLGVLNKSENLTDEDWRVARRAPMARRAGAVPDSRAAGHAVSRDGGLLRAPHEAGPHRVSARGAPARAEHLQQDRRGGRWIRCGDVATRVTTPMSPAAVLAGMRDNPARLRPGHREGLHQPGWRLSRGHAGRARYVRAGHRALGEPEPAGHLPARGAHRQRRPRQRAVSRRTRGPHRANVVEAYSAARSSRPISRSVMESLSATTSSDVLRDRFAALARQGRKALVPYVTAGHPSPVVSGAAALEAAGPMPSKWASRSPIRWPTARSSRPARRWRSSRG